MFYVYITTSCKNGTLYLGHTDDLERRAWQHRTKAMPGFSRKYGCTRLVWFDIFDSREDAKQRERQMKRWKRDWKINLIEAGNPGWRDLSEDFHPLGARHYRIGHHQKMAAHSDP